MPIHPSLFHDKMVALFIGLFDDLAPSLHFDHFPSLHSFKRPPPPQPTNPTHPNPPSQSSKGIGLGIPVCNAGTQTLVSHVPFSHLSLCTPHVTLKKMAYVSIKSLSLTHSLNTLHTTQNPNATDTDRKITKVMRSKQNKQTNKQIKTHSLIATIPIPARSFRFLCRFKANRFFGRGDRSGFVDGRDAKLAGGPAGYRGVGR